MSRIKMTEKVSRFLKRKKEVTKLFEKMDIAAKYVISRNAHLNSLPRV